MVLVLKPVSCYARGSPIQIFGNGHLTFGSMYLHLYVCFRHLYNFAKSAKDNSQLQRKCQNQIRCMLLDLLL